MNSSQGAKDTSTLGGFNFSRDLTDQYKVPSSPQNIGESTHSNDGIGDGRGGKGPVDDADSFYSNSQNAFGATDNTPFTSGNRSGVVSTSTPVYQVHPASPGMVTSLSKNFHGREDGGIVPSEFAQGFYGRSNKRLLTTYDTPSTDGTSPIDDNLEESSENSVGSIPKRHKKQATASYPIITSDTSSGTKEIAIRMLSDAARQLFEQDNKTYEFFDYYKVFDIKDSSPQYNDMLASFSNIDTFTLKLYSIYKQQEMQKKYGKETNKQLKIQINLTLKVWWFSHCANLNMQNQTGQCLEEAINKVIHFQAPALTANVMTQVLNALKRISEFQTENLAPESDGLEDQPLDITDTEDFKKTFVYNKVKSILRTKDMVCGDLRYNLCESAQVAFQMHKNAYINVFHLLKIPETFTEVLYDVLAKNTETRTRHQVGQVSTALKIWWQTSQNYHTEGDEETRLENAIKHVQGFISTEHGQIRHAAAAFKSLHYVYEEYKRLRNVPVQGC